MAANYLRLEIIRLVLKKVNPRL